MTDFLACTAVIGGETMQASHEKSSLKPYMPMIDLTTL
jgi:hypothetical protein